MSITFIMRCMAAHDPLMQLAADQGMDLQRTWRIALARPCMLSTCDSICLCLSDCDRGRPGCAECVMRVEGTGVPGNTC